MAVKHGSTTLSVVKHGNGSGTSHSVMVNARTGRVGMSDPFGQTLYQGTGTYTDVNICTDTSGTYAATITPKTATDASISSRSSTQIAYNLYSTMSNTTVNAQLKYYTDVAITLTTVKHGSITIK